METFAFKISLLIILCRVIVNLDPEEKSDVGSADGEEKENLPADKDVLHKGCLYIIIFISEHSKQCVLMSKRRQCDGTFKTILRTKFLKQI